MASHPDLELSVYYQEDEAPDSPWPDRPLAAYESILPGRWVGRSPRRVHINWDLPDFNAFDAVILNTSYVALATQWLMRFGLRETPWVFWAERLRAQSGHIKRWGQQVLIRPLERADAIVGIGTVAQAAYQQQFPDQRVFNIPYYCDLTAFQEAASNAQSSDDVVEFLCCAQMIHRKGIDVLLQAFDSLIQSGVAARLVLVGREAELPSMMKGVGSGTREHVSVEGFQAPEDLPEYFAKADVFVLPSRHDGWGVVVNQALGAGLPLICSDAVGAAHDLIMPGRNGEIVPAGAVEPLREAMSRLATDAEMRDAYRSAVRKEATRWTPGQGAKRWSHVIQAIVDERYEDTLC